LSDRNPTDFRTGIGYDRHRLSAGTPLILGGVTIPHEKGLTGHSDADVLIHALVDALLGAAALGDIGTHFPDTDPKWKGAKSEQFLKHAASLLKENGFTISFIDCIILAEKPKLSPYFPSIRKNLSAILNLPLDRISVKAKTEEGLDSIGQELAMAVFASATLVRHPG